MYEQPLNVVAPHAFSWIYPQPQLRYKLNLEVPNGDCRSFVLYTHQGALSDNAHSVSLKLTARPFTELYLVMTFIFL